MPRHSTLAASAITRAGRRGTAPIVSPALWQDGAVTLPPHEMDRLRRLVTGGAAPARTAPLDSDQERRLADLVARRLGGLHSARLVLVSLDFEPIEAMQRAGRWDEAGAVLVDAARTLERAGADLLVLCTNTMHIVAPQIEAAATVPLWTRAPM